MPEVQDVLEHCFGLARTGRVEEAAAVAERRTITHPDDGAIWVALGMLRYRQQDHAAASQAIETAGTLIPLDRPTRLVLAECFARIGHAGLGKHVFESLALDDDTPTELLPAVAAGLGYLGEFGSALRVCLELTRRSPLLPEAHFGVAFYLRRLGRPPASVLPIVACAHELAPEVPLYRITLATLLDHVGRRDEARDLLAGVDLDAVSCRCCAQRMATIFCSTTEPDQWAATIDPEPRLH